MPGYTNVRPDVDVLYGERVIITTGRVGMAQLSVMTDPDGTGYSGAASVYLSALQLRSLAALALITAEEIERGMA